MKKTARGFSIHEFTDRNGYECSLQESSIATEHCIWLGVNGPNAKIFIPHGDPAWRDYPLPKAVSCTTRMHLSQEQASELAILLTCFAETGDLESDPMGDDVTIEQRLDLARVTVDGWGDEQPDAAAIKWLRMILDLERKPLRQTGKLKRS